MVNGYGNGFNGDSDDIAGDQNQQDGFDSAEEDKQEPVEPKSEYTSYGKKEEEEDFQRSVEQTQAMNEAEARRQRTEASKLDFSFPKMIADSFPTPEIMGVDFVMSKSYDKIEKIKVKTRVFGDFLDDEWFWEDFLEFFELRVFFVPEVDSTNESIYGSPLFGEEQLVDVKYFNTSPLFQAQDNRLPAADFGMAIPAMNNRSNKLANVYVKEFTLDLAKNLVDLRGTSSAIVARTYFDGAAFANKMLDTTVSNAAEFEGVFSPLVPKNNGKWDFIHFSVNSQSMVDSIRRRYATFIGSTPPKRWSGTFSVTGMSAAGKLEAVTVYDALRAKASVPKVEFNDEPYPKTDASVIKASTLMLQFINTQKNFLKTSVNPNNKKKFEFAECLGDAFSEARIVKNDAGDVNMYFSMDYIQLLKQLSSIPTAVFNNMEKNGLSDTVRNIKVIDQSAGKLTTGKYKYTLDIGVDSDMEEFTLKNVSKLKDAVKNILQFTQAVSRTHAVDPQTGIWDHAFIMSQADGTITNLEKAVDIFYDILESNLLESFYINKFKIYRNRITNNFNQAEFQNKEKSALVVSTKEKAPFTFENNPNLVEYNKPSFAFTFTTADLAMSRQELKDTFQIENMTLVKALEFKNILNAFQIQLLSLIQQDKTPTALSEAKAGFKGDISSAPENFIVLGGIFDATEWAAFYRSDDDIQGRDIVKNPEVLLKFSPSSQRDRADDSVTTYLFNNVEADKLGKDSPLLRKASLGMVAFSHLSLEKNFDFRFTGTVEELTTSDKETDQLEVLDLGDKKFIVAPRNSQQQVIEKESVTKLFLSLSDQPTPPPPAQLEYLSGYAKGVMETSGDEVVASVTGNDRTADDVGLTPDQELEAELKAMDESADEVVVNATRNQRTGGEMKENAPSPQTIMREPIFLPASQLTESDRGRELLFRIKRVGAGKDLPISDGYFVKKV